jgi:hypothetical protein
VTFAAQLVEPKAQAARIGPRSTGRSRVKVVDEVAWTTLSLVAPNGYRVEGLTAGQAIELMRALA